MAAGGRPDGDRRQPHTVTPVRRLALTISGAGLLALTALALVIQWWDSLAWFLVVAGAQGIVHGLAVWSVWRCPSSRRIIIAIAAVAALMRLPVICMPPYLSSDVFRYVWDGRVAAAGIDPYRYVPADPRLTALRDLDIFPHINRANSAVTIYPPVAEAIFFAVTRVSETVSAMKAAMTAFEIVTFILLVQLLAAEGLPTGRVLVYAWHPLPLWEFAGSGHIDAALIALTVAALAAARCRRPFDTGLLLAAASLSKFYPAVLLPALYRRRDWAMPLAFAGGAVFVYLPLIALGWQVIGFLPGYAGEEGFDATGDGFYLLGLIRQVPLLGGFGAWIYLIAATVILAGLAAAAFHVRDTVSAPARAAALAVAFVVLVSPHYAWYFAWLIVFACFVSPAALLWLTNACLLLYLIPVGSHIVRDSYRLAIESMIYWPFAVLGLADLWYRQRRAIRSR
jgi:alpha-1,6-mannosyltransferase